nr:hypothetical protein [Tanacetum cinerariifolium]
SDERVLHFNEIFQIDSCVCQACLQERQLSAEDQKSLIVKTRKD